MLALQTPQPAQDLEVSEAPSEAQASQRKRQRRASAAVGRGRGKPRGDAEVKGLTREKGEDAQAGGGSAGGMAVEEVPAGQAPALSPQALTLAPLEAPAPKQARARKNAKSKASVPGTGGRVKAEVGAAEPAAQEEKEEVKQTEEEEEHEEDAEEQQDGQQQELARERMLEPFRYHHINRRTDNSRFRGRVLHGTKTLSTAQYLTQEEAAHAADRLLYKLKGPEACNFPITPELAAELDALTVEQILEQFRQEPRKQARAPITSRFKSVSWNKPKEKWNAYVTVKGWRGTPSTRCNLGYTVTEEEASDRVKAAAYILGDRCVTKVPLDEYAGLTPEQGRARVVQVLGESKAIQVEKHLQRIGGVVKKRGGMAGSKRRPVDRNDNGDQQEGGREEDGATVGASDVDLEVQVEVPDVGWDAEAEAADA